MRDNYTHYVGVKIVTYYFFRFPRSSLGTVIILRAVSILTSCGSFERKEKITFEFFRKLLTGKT